MLLCCLSIDIENVDSIYQMGLADLWSCDSLKEAFKSSSLPSFYASHPSETHIPTYPHIRNHTLKMPTIFGSTYMFEQTLSWINHPKSPTRSRLTHAHLHHLLQLAVTNMEPDIDHLIGQKRTHTSHCNNGQFVDFNLLVLYFKYCICSCFVLFWQ